MYNKCVLSCCMHKLVYFAPFSRFSCGSQSEHCEKMPMVFVPITQWFDINKIHIYLSIYQSMRQ